MRTLAFLFVLLLGAIVVLGFFRGWFQLSTDTANQKPNATISVDKDKIRADEQEAKDTVQGLGQKAKEKIGDRTGRAKEPARQP
jgi:Asp-tRNA(Asn)/Glu-tRNA(Gln) amidotransferase C subunit